MSTEPNMATVLAEKMYTNSNRDF